MTSMDFSDETYVRLYVRDTVTWKLLSWQARVVMVFMLRSGFDRSGTFQIPPGIVTKRDDQSRNVTSADVTNRDDQSRNVTSEVFEVDTVKLVRSVAAVTELPIEVVNEGLMEIFPHGIWVLTEESVFWPKYVEAQTCSRTSRARKTLERQRRTADAATKTVVEPVTKRDQLSQIVRPRARAHARATAAASDLPTSSGSPDSQEDLDLPNRSGSPDSSEPLGGKEGAAAAGGPGGDAGDDGGLDCDGVERVKYTGITSPAVVNAGSGKVPCPSDLQAVDTVMSMVLEQASAEAVESVRRRFVLRYMSDPADRRTIRAWRKALATALQQDTVAEMRRLQRAAAKELREQEREDAASGKRRSQVFDEREFSR